MEPVKISRVDELYTFFLGKWKFFHRLIQIIKIMEYDITELFRRVSENYTDYQSVRDEIKVLRMAVVELQVKLENIQNTPQQTAKDLAPKSFTTASDIMDRHYRAFQEANLKSE